MNKSGTSLLCLSTAAGDSSKDDSFNKKDTSYDSISLFSKSESDFSGAESENNYHTDTMSMISPALSNLRSRRKQIDYKAQVQNRSQSKSKLSNKPASTKKKFLEK